MDGFPAAEDKRGRVFILLSYNLILEIMDRSLTYSNGHSSPPNEGKPFSYTRAYSSASINHNSTARYPPPAMRRASIDSSNMAPSSPPSDSSFLQRVKQSDSGFLENAIPPLSNMPSLTSSGGECPKHSQERLKYYCQLHDELVCADCLAMDSKHQGHTHTRADDLADSLRSSLQSQLQPLQEMNNDAQSALETMSARRKEITTNGEAIKEAIKMTFTHLHSQLESREKELLGEAEKTIQVKLQQHDAHQSFLETLSSELKQVVESVTQAASDNSNDIILCHHKQLSEWVLEGTRKFQSLPKEVFLPLQAPNISFVVDPTVSDGCSTVGTVTERHADPSRCFIDEGTTRNVTVNQETQLHLLVHDKDSKPYSNHVKGIKVEVTSTTPGASPIDVTIEQDTMKKHQYNISLLPTEAGQYVVKVKIGTTPIKNSPLVINVGAVVHGSLIGDIKGVLQPYGITINDNNEIVVVENGKDCVSIFRSDGKNLRTLSGKGKMKFNRPRGVTITQSNLLLVSDDDGLKQCTQEGKHMIAIGKIGAGPLEFSYPCGLAVSNDGKIYVCDTFNCRIQILNADLSFHQFMGNDLAPPGKLNQPYGVAFNSSGKIFVADYGDHSVKMFTPYGEFLGQITTKNDQDPLKNPVTVHINSNDHVFVGEEKSQGLSVYDSNGKYLTMIPVKASGAYGITTDSQNCVYISDRTNRRIQIFK